MKHAVFDNFPKGNRMSRPGGMRASRPKNTFTNPLPVARPGLFAGLTMPI